MSVPTDSAPEPSQALLVVLGDIGRSPRMQRHALALAEQGVRVILMGHLESPVDPMVAAQVLIKTSVLPTPRLTARGSGGRVGYLVRGLLQALSQGSALWRRLWGEAGEAEFILVQNPPAVPVLPIVAMIARIRRRRWYVDWHNFGASMLALRLGKHSPAVRLARWIEGVSARTAQGHLCVSYAMRRELERDWSMTNVQVLADRPLAMAQEVPLAEQQALMFRIASCVPGLSTAGIDQRIEFDAGAGSLAPDQMDCRRLGSLPTRLPVGWPGAVAARTPAVPLVVAPSSWSVDDDWSLLLDACRQLDARIDHGTGDCRLVILLSGRGPGKSDFEAALAECHYRHLCLATVWLHPEDYRRLLGCADLGLSLHRSTSGVDLPIKVVDMFEAGLPAAVLRYGDCIDELIREGEDAMTFVDAEGLAGLLWMLFFSSQGEERLGRMRDQVKAGEIWREAWTGGGLTAAQASNELSRRQKTSWENCAARAGPCLPISAARDESASRRDKAFAKASAEGGHSKPVSPSTRVSSGPPVLTATTGLPAAMASTGTMPKCSARGG